MKSNSTPPPAVGARSSSATEPRIALVHEWLDSRAGSEKTFERMAANFPNAALFALTQSPDSGLDFDGRPVETTFLQRSTWLRQRRAVSLPIMPLAWLMRATIDADVLVTSSHAFSRYVRNNATVHLSYVYTPMRYAWLPQIDRRGDSWMAAPARKALKLLDAATVNRVDSFAAISTEVAQRIREYYGRDAAVIFPPVEIDRFKPPTRFEDREMFLLGISRWIPYKRLDLVISLGESMGIPVKIAGRGPGGEALRRQAEKSSVPVEIIESPSDVELAELYQRCRMVIFPAYEDFGIVPVEAQAAGAPVVAYGRGGSLDTVADGITGCLADAQSLSAFENAASAAFALGDVTEQAVAHASSFAPEVFDRTFSAWVNAGVDVAEAKR